MLMHPGKGPRPKPEIRSVAVSGIVITFQPSSCLNSFRIREIRVVLPAAGPPVRTILNIFFGISHHLTLILNQEFVSCQEIYESTLPMKL